MALTRRNFLQVAAGTALVASAPASGRAASFPARPITLICPWTAGGSTDLQLRAISEAASKHLGQPVVIEYKAGGAGTVGPAGMAASARPDGYTLSQIPITVFRLPHMQKVTWDPFKDFSYIVHLTGYTFGVVVKADAPWKTFKELIEYSRANPGKVAYGSPGAGTSLHVTMEQIAIKEGVKWTHVPFKGTAENTTALLGGHTQVAADGTGWGALVDAGQLRLLVTWTAQRTKRWPYAPTLKELGYGIVSNSPYGIAGPKGMDPKVVQVIHDAFKKGLDDPLHVKMLDQLDMEPFYLGTADYVKYVRVLFEEEGQRVAQVGLKKT